jgi:hypothetical protein
MSTGHFGSSNPRFCDLGFNFKVSSIFSHDVAISSGDEWELLSDPRRLLCTPKQID